MSKMPLVDELKNSLPPDQVRCMLSSQEKGTSALITTLPLKTHGFSLSTSEFTDALLMRYRLPLSGLPSTCICGQPYSLDHSQCCHVGGFVNMRHDGVRDLLADCMREVINDVDTEPLLKPLNGETFTSPSTITDPDARSDIRARGFWLNQQEAFFDIRIFYPHASSYLNRNLASLYQSFGRQKKQLYNERILNVDRGTLTPMVFSSLGGMGEEATQAVKKLASMLAEKRHETYSYTLGLLRARITFALIRAAGVCLRGTRRRRRYPQPSHLPADVISFAANIS
jgi:hypothetical protein